jgi:hypothetical protein
MRIEVAMRRFLLVALFTIAVPIGLRADVLVLRNGTRVQGELLSVRGGVIEFDSRQTSNQDQFTPGGGRPAGLRERQVIVSADVPWNDAGIEVRAGQTIYLQAAGQVRWGRDRRDGPGGENNSPSNPARPIPNRPAASLIGKVGTSSNDFFFIGDEQGPIRVRSSGRLYLGINDDFLSDNSGNFRVVIYY